MLAPPLLNLKRWCQALPADWSGCLQKQGKITEQNKSAERTNEVAGQYASAVRDVAKVEQVSKEHPMQNGTKCQAEV